MGTIWYRFLGPDGVTLISGGGTKELPIRSLVRGRHGSQDGHALRASSSGGRHGGANGKPGPITVSNISRRLHMRRRNLYRNLSDAAGAPAVSQEASQQGR